jgi:protein-S-isoprenylcysteine O-methyltransferase Ste14
MIKIYPPVWFLSFLALGLLAHFFVPATRVFDMSIPLLDAILSAALIIMGFGLSLRASNLFAIEKTEIRPTSPQNRVLITYGPYKISRNPMYLGMVLILLGVGFAIGTLPMFVAALADFLVLNFVFIPFQEAKMARQFGPEYEAYKKSVRRWL